MIDHLCKAVMAQLRPVRFVDTGTFNAATVAEVSVWFAEFYPNFGVITHLTQNGIKGSHPWSAYISYPVFRAVPAVDFLAPPCRIYSIDRRLEYVERGREIFAGNPNIEFVHGNSNTTLARLISGGDIKAAHRPFFYLDAFSTTDWPLREELAVALNLEKAIIVIDGFEVPGYPHWEFDTYNGKPCGISTIADLLSSNPCVSMFFPVRANRDNRGWAILFKGFAESELDFMLQLPFVKYAPPPEPEPPHLEPAPAPSTLTSRVLKTIGGWWR